MNPLLHINAFISSLSRSRTSDRIVVLGLMFMIALGVVAVLYVIVSAAGNDNGGAGPKNDSDFLAKFEWAVPPSPVPDTPFINPDGEMVTFADHVGRYVLVNLWATWCAPCRLEMPSLDRLQARLGSENFEVMLISVDRAGLKKSAEFMEELGMQNLKTYNDKTFAVARALGVEGLPTTILLDAEGNEVGRLSGPAEWDSSEVINFIEDLISVN